MEEKFLNIYMDSLGNTFSGCTLFQTKGLAIKNIIPGWKYIDTVKIKYHKNGTVQSKNE